MGKYDPLRALLFTNGQARITLSFREIEQAIGGDLPASARSYPAWWANEAEGRHVQARAWLDAGYRVDSVSPSGGQVRFARMGTIDGRW